MLKPPLKDMKASLSSSEKADLTHVRTPLLTYCARNCEYGSSKYERSNFLRPAGTRLADDFNRLRAYLRAMLSHGFKTLDAMEQHQSTDPQLVDEDGMRRACYAEDKDTDGKTPASGLPHIGGCASSLNMALTQAVNAGLLPADPGRPWEKK